MGISYTDKTNTTGIWKLSEIYKKQSHSRELGEVLFLNNNRTIWWRFGDHQM